MGLAKYCTLNCSFFFKFICSSFSAGVTALHWARLRWVWGPCHNAPSEAGAKASMLYSMCATINDERTAKKNIHVWGRVYVHFSQGGPKICSSATGLDRRAVSIVAASLFALEACSKELIILV